MSFQSVSRLVCCFKDPTWCQFYFFFFPPREKHTHTLSGKGTDNRVMCVSNCVCLPWKYVSYNNPQSCLFLLLLLCLLLRDTIFTRSAFPGKEDFGKCDSRHTLASLKEGKKTNTTQRHERKTSIQGGNSITLTQLFSRVACVCVRRWRKLALFLFMMIERSPAGDWVRISEWVSLGKTNWLWRCG